MLFKYILIIEILIITYVYFTIVVNYNFPNFYKLYEHNVTKYDEKWVKYKYDSYTIKCVPRHTRIPCIIPNTNCYKYKFEVDSLVTIKCVAEMHKYNIINFKNNNLLEYTCHENDIKNTWECANDTLTQDDINFYKYNNPSNLNNNDIIINHENIILNEDDQVKYIDIDINNCRSCCIDKICKNFTNCNQCIHNENYSHEIYMDTYESKQIPFDDYENTLCNLLTKTNYKKMLITNENTCKKLNILISRNITIGVHYSVENYTVKTKIIIGITIIYSFLYFLLFRYIKKIFIN